MGGKKRKLKAEFAGDKEGKPPFRCHSGRVNKCRWGSAPAGLRPRRFNQRRPGSASGDARGEALASIFQSPPSPEGKGDGGKKES